MKKTLLSLLFLAYAAFGQRPTTSVSVFASVGALPATCKAGQIAFVSNATPGAQLYVCSATNTWTQQSGGGGGATIPSTTNVIKGDGAGNGANTKVAITSPTTAATLSFPTDNATITFQGTDTYVGRATTDTLTNKTYDTAGTGNVFKINGTGITAVSGTGAVCLATGSSCGSGITGLTTSAIVSAASSTTIQTPSSLATLDSSGNIIGASFSTPSGSVGGYLSLGQGTATTAPTASVGFMAPTAVSTKFMMTLPAAPVTGFLLNTGTTDPSVISFVAPNGTGSKVQLFTGSAPATNDCAKFDVNGNIVTAGAACGAGSISGLTTGFFTKAASATTIANSLCDEAITTANTLTCTNTNGAKFVSLSTGTSPPSLTVGSGGVISCGEGTAPTGASSVDAVYCDSTLHDMAVTANGGSAKLIESVAAKIHLTAQTASISTATLCAASAGACNQAGQYRVKWDFIETGTACSSVVAGSVTFALTWTDSNATSHAAVIMPMLNQTGATSVAQGNSFTFATALANAGASGDFIISTNGAVIQYATTYTGCTTGTGTYQLDAVVTRVQ